MKNTVKVLLGLGSIVALSNVNRGRLKINKANIEELVQTLPIFIRNNVEILNSYGITSMPIFYDTNVINVEESTVYSTTAYMTKGIHSKYIYSNIKTNVDNKSNKYVVYHLINFLQNSASLKDAKRDLIILYLSNCIMHNLSFPDSMYKSASEYAHKQAKVIYKTIMKNMRG